LSRVGEREILNEKEAVTIHRQVANLVHELVINDMKWYATIGQWLPSWGGKWLYKERLLSKPDYFYN